MVKLFRHVFEEIKEVSLAAIEFLDALSLIMITGIFSLLPIWVIVAIISYYANNYLFLKAVFWIFAGCVIWLGARASFIILQEYVKKIKDLWRDHDGV